MFYKTGPLKNFAKFAEKHLCQSLFLDKVSGWDLQHYQKGGSGTGVFSEFLEIFQSIFFTEHGWTTASNNSRKMSPRKKLSICYNMIPPFPYVNAQILNSRALVMMLQC